MTGTFEESFSNDRSSAPDETSARDRLTQEFLLHSMFGDDATSFGVPARHGMGRKGLTVGRRVRTRPSDELNEQNLDAQTLLDPKTIRTISKLGYDTSDARAHNSTVIDFARSVSTRNYGEDPSSEADGAAAQSTRPSKIRLRASGWVFDTADMGIDPSRLQFEGHGEANATERALFEGDPEGDFDADMDMDVQALVPTTMLCWDRPESLSAAYASLIAREFVDDPALDNALRRFAPAPVAIVRVADEKHCSEVELLFRRAVLPDVGQDRTHAPLRFDERTRVGILTGYGRGMRRDRALGADTFAWSCLGAGVPLIGIANDYVKVLPPEHVLSATHCMSLERLDGHAILTAIEWSADELRTMPAGWDEPSKRALLIELLDGVAPLVSWRMLQMVCSVDGDMSKPIARLDALLHARTEGYELPRIGDAMDDADEATRLRREAARFHGTRKGSTNSDPVSQREIGWRPQTPREAYPVPQTVLAKLGPTNEQVAEGTGFEGVLRGMGITKAPEQPSKASEGTLVEWWDERTGRLRTSDDPRDRDAVVRRPTLDRLHGYGAAKDWGLNAAADLRSYADGDLDWADVDNAAVVLSGPPGVGKTQFAKALARSARVRLVETSVAAWQATDHLGKTLEAIRESFAQAKAARPSVLFVDELDGISSRSALSGRDRTYWSQCVNLLLTEVVELMDHGGVLLLGATNHPEMIDPALMRSGRFDRHVRIELPDRSDIERILIQYLGGDLAEDADEAESTTEGATE